MSNITFAEAIEDLKGGSFTKLDPLFVDGSIVAWHKAGRFQDQPEALREVLTCACFNGRIDVAEYLLNHGVELPGGSGTGMDALNWAVNRGQLEAVRLLLRWKAPLEARTMHGTTALGTARWSAENEPRADHAQIIEELLNAGAEKH